MTFDKIEIYSKIMFRLENYKYAAHITCYNWLLKQCPCACSTRTKDFPLKCDRFWMLYKPIQSILNWKNFLALLRNLNKLTIYKTDSPPDPDTHYQLRRLADGFVNTSLNITTEVLESHNTLLALTSTAFSFCPLSETHALWKRVKFVVHRNIL
jgi:hypothetical protein